MNSAERKSHATRTLMTLDLISDLQKHFSDELENARVNHKDDSNQRTQNRVFDAKAEYLNFASTKRVLRNLLIEKVLTQSQVFDILQTMYKPEINAMLDENYFPESKFSSQIGLANLASLGL